MHHRHAICNIRFYTHYFLYRVSFISHFYHFLAYIFRECSILLNYKAPLKKQDTLYVEQTTNSIEFVEYQSKFILSSHGTFFLSFFT